MAKYNPDLKLGYNLDLFKGYKKKITEHPVRSTLHEHLEKVASIVSKLKKGVDYITKQGAEVKVSKHKQNLFLHIYLEKSLLDSLDNIVEFLGITGSADDFNITLDYSKNSKKEIKDIIYKKFNKYIEQQLKVDEGKKLTEKVELNRQ